MSVAIGNRSGFEQAVKDRQKELAAQYGRKDRIITNDEIEALAAEFFGNLEAPEGAEILKQTPIELIYRTKDGQEIRQFRNLNPNLGSSIGKVDEKVLNAPPPVQGSPQATALTDELGKQIRDYYAQFPPGTGPNQDKINALAEKLQQPVSLQNIDPSTQSYLDSIAAATDAKNNQLFQDQEGDLLAKLYGQGTNRSTVAGNAAARLTQQQGLVNTQAQSDAAQRQLAVQQLLAQLTGQNNTLALDALTKGADIGMNQVKGGQDLLSTLLNQMLQRDVANKNFDLQGRELDMKADQALVDNQFRNDSFEYQAEQKRKADRAALVKSIVGAGLSFLPGIGGLGGLIGGAIGGAASSGINHGLGGGE